VINLRNLKISVCFIIQIFQLSVIITASNLRYIVIGYVKKIDLHMAADSCLYGVIICRWLLISQSVIMMTLMMMMMMLSAGGMRTCADWCGFSRRASGTWTKQRSS